MEGVSAPFRSILFDGEPEEPDGRVGVAPGYFEDLNLYPVVEAITAGLDEHDLKQFFYRPLRRADDVLYRQAVHRDLESNAVLSAIDVFTREMRTMRQHLVLAGKVYYQRQREGLFFEAVRAYCGAVEALAQSPGLKQARSQALDRLRGYLTRYVGSGDFTSLAGEVAAIRDDLAAVRYTLTIKGNHISVDRYTGQEDYGTEIERTFARFKQGAVKNYRVRFPMASEMDHVEAGVLELVAKLYPDVFASLRSFFQRRGAFLDDTVARVDRELHFYLAYREYLHRFTNAGLPVCYPQVSAQSKEVFACETFDIALADKLVGERAVVVRNDWHLSDRERVFVVTGPNQGGKTTFARTFGQLHHLASIGCQVPGREARLFLFDRLFTHFERREQASSLAGKLEGDLLRVHSIVEQGTPDSIVIMNESFTSTSLEDSLLLGSEVLGRLIALDLLCVYVTFVDELAELADTVVSVTSTVNPDDPVVRTFKLVRRPADGRAYALAIAEKHGLTYDRLMERIAS